MWHVAFRILPIGGGSNSPVFWLTTIPAGRLAAAHTPAVPTMEPSRTPPSMSSSARARLRTTFMKISPGDLVPPCGVILIRVHPPAVRGIANRGGGGATSTAARERAKEGVRGERTGGTHRGRPALAKQGRERSHRLDGPIAPRAAIVWRAAAAASV